MLSNMSPAVAGVRGGLCHLSLRRSGRGYPGSQGPGSGSASPAALDRLGRAERAHQRLDFVFELTTELRAAGLLEPCRLHGIERERADLGHAEASPETH